MKGSTFSFLLSGFGLFLNTKGYVIFSMVEVSTVLLLFSETTERSTVTQLFTSCLYEILGKKLSLGFGLCDVWPCLQTLPPPSHTPPLFVALDQSMTHQSLESYCC